ncbi:MAG: hypothetical protein QM831_08315 [Kofleriaceae bacterium]
MNSNSVTCGDLLCPAGTVCDSQHSLCVLPEQLSACAGGSANAPCMYGGSNSGFCTDGTCLPQRCGDSLVNGDEACDAKTDPPTCSDDCKSDLTCGNHIVDVMQGEQCDDQNHVDGDGCSSHCQIETPTWSQFSLHPGKRFTDQGGVAYDTSRDRMIVFGGNAVGNSAVPTSDLLEWDGEHWIRPYQAAGPSARDGAGLAYDVDKGVTVMFGGYANGSRGDTWTWDGITWKSIDGAGPPPTGNAAMVYDAKRKVIVLFGGQHDIPTTVYTNDTWEWNGTWSKITTPTAPSIRWEAMMAFDPKHGNVVLVGGINPQADAMPKADTWIYADHTWTEITTANTPTNLIGGSIVWDPASQKLLLLGGATNGPAVNSIYAWDGATWTKLTQTLPVARASMFAATVRDHIVMFAGNTTGTSDDTVLYANGVFTTVADLGTRVSSNAVNLLASRSVLVHGGFIDNSGNSTAQSWLLSTSGDALVMGTQPEGTAHACMTWDVAHSNVVLWGGQLTSPTWTFKTNAWTKLTPTTSPSPARLNPGCAFDGTAVTLMGGTFGNGGLSDVWSWDGTTWAQQPAPPTGVGPRNSQATAYAPDHGFVMYGGGTIGTGNLSDSWTFDHTTWLPATTFAPPTRDNPIIAWNYARGKLIMAGGADGNSIDTYEFDGAWHVVPALNAPPERHSQFGFSTLDGGGIAGYGGTGTFATTPADGYELRWISDLPHDNCDGTDLDHDGLTRCDDPDCWTICYPGCPLATTATGCDPSKGPYCGDGICDGPRETGRTCPHDCTVTAVCGDGYCDTGETAASCPGDCM